MAEAIEESEQTGDRPSIRVVHTLPLVPVFIVGLLAAQPIRDNSLLWHIRAGAIQLADGLVIVADPFSISMNGTAWRTQSWLVELLYAYLDGFTDTLTWVNLFVFGVGAAAAAMIGLSIYRSTASPVTLSVALVAMTWLASPFLQPRPVIVSYLLLAMLVVVLQNRTASLWLVIPIIWIWSAVHGSWVIGGGLLILEWIRTSDRRILRVGIVALLATILTAHGLGTWRILVDFAGAQGALEFIDEWQSPDFGGFVQAPYLLLIAGVIVAGMRGKLSGRDLVVILPFLFFGMTSRRAVFPAAIVVAPWAALALPALKVPRSSMPPRLVGAVMVVLALVTLSPLIVRPLGLLDVERFPSVEIQDAMRGREVFHGDVVGGFLIYDEWPDRLVFIDDRAELYGEEFFSEFLRARDGQYEVLFSEFGFTSALTREEWGLTDRLDRDGWVRAVEANSMILFNRPQG